MTFPLPRPSALPLLALLALAFACVAFAPTASAYEGDTEIATDPVGDQYQQPAPDSMSDIRRISVLANESDLWIIFRVGNAQDMDVGFQMYYYDSAGEYILQGRMGCYTYGTCDDMSYNLIGTDVVVTESYTEAIMKLDRATLNNPSKGDQVTLYELASISYAPGYPFPMVYDYVGDSGIAPFAFPNAPPVFSVAAPQDAVNGVVVRAQGEGVAFTLSGTDFDDDTLTYSVLSAPAGARYTIDPATGAFLWERIWCNHPVGNNEFVFRVSDGTHHADAALTVTVTDTDCDPIFPTIGDKTVAENAILRFTARARDPDTGALVPTLTTVLPAGASYNAQTGAFAWRTTCTQAGGYVVGFEVLSGDVRLTQSVTIDVTDANCAPTLRNPGNPQVDPSRRLGISLRGLDRDGDTLTYSVSNLPEGARFNQTTGRFGWIPTEEQAGGVYIVTFRVTDAGGLFAERTSVIRVSSSLPPA